MRVCRHILLLLLTVLISSELYATHVAGGSMTYRCLGNSRYEVSLEFRRDCFNGARDAQFDRFASVTIFNSNNQLMVTLGNGGEVRIPFIDDDTLNERLTSICNVIGDDVCVQTTVYKDTIILPARPGGYILAYQRCCRNNALSNVADPLNTGATYWVRITERALMECNNSPVFDNLPGVFICVNDTLRFNHKATDVDGDSLVYFLCTPSSGATEPEPMPQPSNPPPFDKVVWKEGFSENNMMGGSPISIHPQTGQLLAVPNQVGQFLIGVCVREFRDGVLLSEVRRDFEYAVRICGRDPIAGFESDTNLNCDGLEINFENLTTSNFLPLDSIEFEWVFDYPDGNLVSDEVNPTVTYPEAGMYDVRMIATDGVCFDTLFTTVGVAPDGDPTANFAFESYDCDGETVVQFYQTSITSQPNAEHYWTVRYGNKIENLVGESPSLEIGDDQTLIVNYEIRTPSGCNDVISEEIEISTIPLTAEYEDKIICSGENVVIFQTDIPGAQVDIEPSQGVQTDGAGSYFVNGFSGNVSYLITITDGFCLSQGTVTITSEAEPDFPFNDIIQCGSDTVALNEAGPDFYYYEWEGPGITDPQEANPEVSIMGVADYFVTVYTSEGSLCSFSDSLSVQSSELPVFEILKSQTGAFCEGDTFTLSLNQEFPIMNWVDDQNRPVGNTSSIVIPDLNRDTRYTVTVINEDGCSSSESVELEYSRLPVINVSGNSTRMVCRGEDAELRVVSLDSISWLDEDGNFLTSGFRYTVQDIVEPVTLTVRATNDLGCEEEIELSVGVHPDPEPDFSPLDSIVICPGMIIPVSIISQDDVSWFNESGQLIEQGPDWLIENIEEDTDFSIRVENEFGCFKETDFSVRVDRGIVPEVDLEILDSVQLCIETDFRVNLSSPDSIRWFDLNGNLLQTGTEFIIPDVVDTLFFQVSVIDSFNCELRDTFSINPFAGIELDITGSGTSDFYCEGESIDLGTSTNVAADIQWYLDGELINTGDSLIEYFPSGDLFFEAIAEDRFGCMSRDSFFLRESTTGGEIVGDDLICIDGIAALEYMPDDTGDVFSVDWTPAGSIIEDNGLSIIVQLDSTESYFVLYANEDGCISTDSFQVDVSGFYEGIMAFADPQEILLGETTELSTDQFSDFDFLWTPGDLLDDDMSDMPIAMPVESTTFIVTVTDEFGCSDTAEVTVDVIQPNCDESDIYVPNSFTPNGDQLNDVFRVESNFIDEQKIMVYNRWGEEVFYSEDPDAEWDGSYKGEPLASDVYGFYVEIRCINGFEYSTQGNITLFR